MDAWSKIELGWVTPTVISPSIEPYVLGPQCETNIIFKITTNFPAGEYLLVENRQKVCHYDSQMGGSYSGGLVIYHIDENASFNVEGYPGQSGWPQNGNHYRVAVLPADGYYDLERGYNRGDFGDVYRDGDSLVPSTSSEGPYPNSDSYASGTVTKTGVSITNIATVGNNDVSFLFESDLQTISPTQNPTEAIGTGSPTTAWTSSPTPAVWTAYPTTPIDSCPYYSECSV
jgi:hypothetical protein